MISIEENMFENVVCQRATILFSPQCVTHCRLVTPYSDVDLWVNIGSDNGMLPDGTKALP